MVENVKVNDNIVFREEGEEAFLFDVGTGMIKILNASGAFVWKLCDGRHTKEEIMNKMVEDFEVERETAEKDLEIFFSDLKKSGLALNA